MSQITTDYVKALGLNAKLELDDELAAQAVETIKSFEKDAARLAEVDTTDVRPTYHGNNLRAVMRADVPEEGTPNEQLFSNIAEQERTDYIVVPAMISDGEA